MTKIKKVEWNFNPEHPYAGFYLFKVLSENNELKSSIGEILTEDGQEQLLSFVKELFHIDDDFEPTLEYSGCVYGNGILCFWGINKDTKKSKNYPTILYCNC